MSYLQEDISGNLAARITNKGRKKIAQGDFNIAYFQVGDSEYDYAFSDLNGNPAPAQRVLMPFDKDSQVKYPYKVSSSTLTGTTYGTPIQSAEVETIVNNMGAAGNVSGTTVVCGHDQVSISNINGTSVLTVTNGALFTGSTYITLFMAPLSTDTITTAATSLIYRITGITSNTLYLDRKMPNLSALTPQQVTVIANYCNPSPDFPEEQQDPWILNNIWSKTPAGLDPAVDERLSGYTSNVFVSTKEYFGYNTSSGQTSNSGTTITNAFGDVIIVSPEEQHSLSLLHYSKDYNEITDFDLIFKYDDYIDHTTDPPVDGTEYFEVYIPFMYYERTGSTIGAKFHMDTVDYYINTSATDGRVNQMKFRYLLDALGNRVGKIFVNHKVIIFDDQEIVAILDYKSNRRHTLPIPRVTLVPMDSKCGEDSTMVDPLIGGTGDTVFVSYLLTYTGDKGLNGLHCNHYVKITGTTTTGDISVKFNTNDFRFMRPDSYTASGTTVGYMAHNLYMLVQKVSTGSQPAPESWKIIDVTADIPNHTPGDIIDPVNLRNTAFIITDAQYDVAALYDLETYLENFPNEPSTLPEFGDQQYFAGSIKLVRATDLEVMNYFVNLPSGYFETTQNPSYIAGKPKRITEVALLDENKEVLVIAKASSPIQRVGSQVLAVKIDI